MKKGPGVRFEQSIAKSRFKKDEQNLKDDVEDLKLKKVLLNRPSPLGEGQGVRFAQSIAKSRLKKMTKTPTPMWKI